MTTKNPDSPAFSPRDFRDALSSFATGVSIITAASHEGEKVGMTASSFNSVSIEPPLVLWSLTKAARSAPVFQAAEHFAIHILAADQTALSNQFARSGADKFAGTDFTLTAQGVPLLAGALAIFECNTWAIYDGGDHWIIVGEVKNIHREQGEGLVFAGGSYATATTIQTPAPKTSEPHESEGEVENLLFYHLSRAYRQMGDQFHQAVHESGLSLGQWRVLASLYGGAVRDIHDLEARTFIEGKTLSDLVHTMADQGLCQLSSPGGDLSVSGTEAGHSRVQHLFELGANQERAALQGAGAEGSAELRALLKIIVSNTNKP